MILRGCEIIVTPLFLANLTISHHLAT